MEHLVRLFDQFILHAEACVSQIEAFRDTAQKLLPLGRRLLVAVLDIVVVVWHITAFVWLLLAILSRLLH